MRINLLFRIVLVTSGLVIPPQAVLAQQISFGVVAGTNLTKDFHIPDWPEAKSGSSSFIIGPMMEVGISRDFSVEVNALHRYLRYDYVYRFQDGTIAVSGQDKSGTWEFPILAKYRVPVSTARPFVEAGPSFRTFSDRPITAPSGYGFTTGVGLEMRIGRMNIAPALRYTRWGADARPLGVSTAQNQVELLVGFSYPTTSVSREMHGHKLWLGLIAGIPLTSDFAERKIYTGPGTPMGSVTRNFDVRAVAGLLGELELSDRLALEVNGLYRRLHFDDGPEVVVTWQIPVLAKYKFSVGKLKPFLEAGPSFRLAGNLHATNPSHYGITSGIGLESQWRRLKISPVVRYTRWAKDSPSSFPLVQEFLKQDQVELLFGFSF